MRESASNSSRVVDVLADNAEAFWSSETSDGWYKVLHNGTEGYFTADHVSIDQELGNGRQKRTSWLSAVALLRYIYLHRHFDQGHSRGDYWF